MAYVKTPIPSEVYHLTQIAKLDDILDDGKIRCFGDTECWFCESLEKMRAYMEQTVLCEGKAYYGIGGQLCHYPKFEPDKHIILKLTPCRREGNWYRWDQEIPLNSPPELVQAAAEFSKLKIGYRGDLVFQNAETIDDLSRRDLSYLLQFENPLEVLRDRWVLDQSTEQGTRFLGMLESLRSEGHAEQDHPLDEAYAQIQKNEMSMQF